MENNQQRIRSALLLLLVFVLILILIRFLVLISLDKCPRQRSTDIVPHPMNR